MFVCVNAFIMDVSYWKLPRKRHANKLACVTGNSSNTRRVVPTTDSYFGIAGILQKLNHRYSHGCSKALFMFYCLPLLQQWPRVCICLKKTRPPAGCLYGR